jgi:hypothetical protein
MNSYEWRRYVLAECIRLGVQVEVLASGAVRMVSGHDVITVTDALYVTHDDLHRLAGSHASGSMNAARW